MFATHTDPHTPSYRAFVVLTWIFNFVFFVTSGPLSWAIPAELFGTAMRLKGVSVGAMTSFAANTMIGMLRHWPSVRYQADHLTGQVTPIALTAIGWKFYIVFVVCNLLNAVSSGPSSRRQKVSVWRTW